ncbi:Uncharacterised protein [uncultured archaeon]|nr:Uncharacterised protein [uncultured archaeon]
MQRERNQVEGKCVRHAKFFPIYVHCYQILPTDITIANAVFIKLSWPQYGPRKP